MSAHFEPNQSIPAPAPQLLSELVGVPWSVPEALRAAVALAVVVGRFHTRERVHGELQPRHLAYDARTGEASIVGPDRARREMVQYARERMPQALAYISPEQTGRMNRLVDGRSDLYALGIVLYELVTGAPPFAARDALEWVHCHVARQPPPLDVARVGVGFAAILGKLLAKEPEQRYQTAAGLEADLRRCQVEPAGFELALHDARDRLVIPDTLYGRAAESTVLRAAFERVMASGEAEIVLVSGPSGAGKSSVVGELQRSVVAAQAWFCAGKFDQYKRDIPYATLVQAFQLAVRQLLASREAELVPWREAFRTALGPNGQLVVGLIPELEALLGSQPELLDLPPHETRARFLRVLRQFLGVFARPEHPLVLFLDDLQWLDAATLEWLQHVLDEPAVGHVLVVGAYRDQEVAATHPLRSVIDGLRRAPASLVEIELAPLAPADVTALVADSLHSEPAAVARLAELVHDRTAGSPFFVTQFLTALADDGLLVFDSIEARWSWDLSRLRSKPFTDNVADLIGDKLDRLGEAEHAALRTLACLGNTVDDAVLALVLRDLGHAPQEVLLGAVDVGLVVRGDGAYSFLHDRVREAAYSSWPAAERAVEHLRIGRLLAAAPGDLGDGIFEVVNQLGQALELLHERSERQQAASYFLLASRRAKAATAFASALAYLVTGEQLLGADGWTHATTLAFELAFERSECELLTGELTAAERRLAELAERATTVLERAAIACARIDLFTLLDQSDRSVEVGLAYLAHVGVDWSAHPTEAQLRLEYDHMWGLLGDRPVQAILDLPLMQDASIRATMDVLTKLQVPALFSDERLHGMVIGRAANLSLAHGNSDGSCFAYCELGGFLGAHFGQYSASAAFAQVAVTLVERPRLGRFKARVYTVFGNTVTPWIAPLRSALEPLRRAREIAAAEGDLTFTIYAANHLVTIALGIGSDLAELERDIERGGEEARRTHFGMVADFFTAQLALVRSLRGAPAAFADVAFERRLDADPRLAIAACWYWIRKLQALCVAGDYAEAYACEAPAERLLWTCLATFETAEYSFYAGLARAGRHDSLGIGERAGNLEALRAHLARVRTWAEHCPANFLDRSSLLEAELARIEQRPHDADVLYERTIRAARAEGYVHVEALAHERAAVAARSRGLDTVATLHVAAAQGAHRRWGALAKVEALALELPREDPGARRAGAEAGLELDVATVLKMAQAVSGEIELSRLIERLMVISVEHAGASRGVLVLSDGEPMRIAADARDVDGQLVVTLENVASTDLPESILRYVTRTHESVIVADAQLPNEFAADAYLARGAARSVSCLPLLKQGVLTGMLYLENSHASHVFTPARVEALRVLAAQASISLENARLYTELRREDERVKSSLAEKEALLKEVHHRVKNNLQLVSSLLSLQAVNREPAVAELFAESRNRVRSMALVHENLYRAGSFASIPMETHVHTLCTQLARAYALDSTRVELRVDVEDVHLDIDRAVTVGLIVNELVSNAAKHAFPDGGAGIIRVSLREGPEGCELRVEDDGCGIPGDVDVDLGRADSLGLQLVHDLTAQLQGVLTVTATAGTRFSIAFRAGSPDRWTPARILVVEDNRIVARDIRLQLTKIGHEVVGLTARGEEVVQLARSARADLVLMDIRLEGELDGIQAAQQLRDRLQIPVVFLTAYADDQTLERAGVPPSLSGTFSSPSTTRSSALPSRWRSTSMRPNAGCARASSATPSRWRASVMQSSPPIRRPGSRS